MADVNIAVKIATLPTSGYVDVTEAGFGTVKAAMAFACYAPENVHESAAQSMSVGAWDGTTQKCAYAGTDNQLSTNDSNRGYNNYFVAFTAQAAVNITYTVSAITDGLRITLNSGSTSSTRMVAIIMFSGSDVKAVVGTTPSLGTSATTTSITGLSLFPKTIFFGCSGLTSNTFTNNCIMSFGAANIQDNTIKNSSILWSDQDGVGTTRIGNWCSNVYSMGQHFQDVLAWAGQVTAIYNNGFDITTNAGADSDVAWYLAMNLGNHSFRIKDYNMPTSDGVYSITGLGFRPQQVIHCSSYSSAFNSNSQYLGPQIGVSDGITEASVHSHGVDGVSTSDVGSIASGVLVAMRWANTPNSSGELVTGTVDSFTSDGIDINFDPANVSPFPAFVMAFGKKKTIQLGTSYKYLVLNKL